MPIPRIIQFSGLAVDESPGGAKMKDAAAAQAFGVSVRTVELLRERLVEEGLDAALERKKQVRPVWAAGLLLAVLLAGAVLLPHSI